MWMIEDKVFFHKKDILNLPQRFNPRFRVNFIL